MASDPMMRRECGCGRNAFGVEELEASEPTEVSELPDAVCASRVARVVLAACHADTAHSRSEQMAAVANAVNHGRSNRWGSAAGALPNSPALMRNATSTHTKNNPSETAAGAVRERG